MWETAKKTKVEIGGGSVEFVATGHLASIVSITGDLIKIELSSVVYTGTIEQDGTALMLLWDDGDRWTRIRRTATRDGPHTRRNSQSRASASPLPPAADLADVQGDWILGSVEVHVNGSIVSWSSGARAQIVANDKTGHFELLPEQGGRVNLSATLKDGALCWCNGSVWTRRLVTETQDLEPEV